MQFLKACLIVAYLCLLFVNNGFSKPKDSTKHKSDFSNLDDLLSLIKSKNSSSSKSMVFTFKNGTHVIHFENKTSDSGSPKMSESESSTKVGSKTKTTEGTMKTSATTKPKAKESTTPAAIQSDPPTTKSTTTTAKVTAKPVQVVENGTIKIEIYNHTILDKSNTLFGKIIVEFANKSKKHNIKKVIGTVKFDIETDSFKAPSKIESLLGPIKIQIDDSVIIENKTVTGFNMSVPVCVKGFKEDASKNFICLTDSKGNQRAAHEIDCVFPFEHNGSWQDRCIKGDKKFYWCSLDRKYNKRFAKCNDECPLIARHNVRNDKLKRPHTMCLQPKPEVVSHIPTADEIKIIIDMHNQIRAEVDPPATNMGLVQWDVGLAQLAQRWVDNAVFEHDCSACRSLISNRSVQVGQNGFMGGGFKYNSSTFWKTVVTSWWNEKQFFKYDSPMDLQKVGHYTQIITAESIRVGCGAAMLQYRSFGFCNYAIAQYNYLRPYEKGDSCSKCEKKNCKNKLCKCSKFCQNYGELDPFKCKCKCKEWATGDECETLLCSKRDAEYGCWEPNNPRMCTFANTVYECPHLCGLCSVKIELPSN